MMIKRREIISENNEVWYRYYNFCYAGEINDFGECIGRSIPVIELKIFRVIYHTPKGVQLLVNGEKHFVKHDGIKKFAHACKEEAWQSF